MKQEEPLSFSYIALALLDQSHNSVMITTPLLDGDHPKILYVNDAFTQMTGYSKDEIIGKTPRILQGPLTDKAIMEQLKESLRNEDPFEGEAINYKKDGNIYWVQWNITPVRDENGTIISYVSFQKDVTVEKMFSNHIRLFQQAIDQNHDSIALFDPHGNYIYANTTYLKRTGHEQDELIGQNARILKSGQHDSAYYKQLWQTLLEGKSFKGIFINKNKEGVFYYEKQTITPLFKKEELIGFVVVGKSYDHDIALQHELAQRSRIDPLTSLPNRMAFDEDLIHLIEQYKLKKLSFSLLYADIDNFKQVNDTKGHDVGDEALKSVSSFCLSVLRHSDHVYRVGGDEFAFLLLNIDENGIIETIERMATLFANSPFPSFYNIGLSIGGIVYNGEDREEFVYNADQAMYMVKQDKKHHYN